QIPGEPGALRETVISVGVRVHGAAFGTHRGAIPLEVCAGAVAVRWRRGGLGGPRGLGGRGGVGRRDGLVGALLAPALTLKPGRLTFGGRPLARVSHPRPPPFEPARRASRRAGARPRGSPHRRLHRSAGRSWS